MNPFEAPPIAISAALMAGLFSFASPCVLPLIPGYLSFISGVSIEDLGSNQQSRSQYGKLVINTLFFVLGFSLVFIMLGAAAGSISTWLVQNKILFGKIAGVLVFFFGLHVAGVFKLKALNYEKRFNMASAKGKGIIGSAVIGAAFAFGWTPCIGPILGSILTLAAQQNDVSKGMGLLAVYSAGLGIPFILTALMFNYLMGAFGFLKRHFRAIEILSGGLLMAVGLLMFFNLLNSITNYLLELFPAWGEIG